MEDSGILPSIHLSHQSVGLILTFPPSNLGFRLSPVASYAKPVANVCKSVTFNKETRCLGGKRGRADFSEVQSWWRPSRARRCRMPAPPGLVEDGAIWVLFSTFSSACYFFLHVLCVFLLKGWGGVHAVHREGTTEIFRVWLLQTFLIIGRGKDSLLSQPRFCLFVYLKSNKDAVVLDAGSRI